jgi:hypothetical protein
MLHNALAILSALSVLAFAGGVIYSAVKSRSADEDEFELGRNERVQLTMRQHLVPSCSRCVRDG